MTKNPHERKRREKAAAKRLRERESESLAYLGEKYKKEELIQSLMHSEIGIYEAYIISGRKLTDKVVIAALEKLIRGMRAKNLPPLPAGNEVVYNAGDEVSLVIGNVRRNWKQHFANNWRPPTDDLIGVVRTILGSIEKVRSSSPFDQSYLKHIEGFLTKKLGVSVQGFSGNPSTGAVERLPEPPADLLVELGQQWIEGGNQESRAEFFELATRLLQDGEISRVTGACHLLMGSISDPQSEIVAELIAFIKQAAKGLVAKSG